MVALTAPHTSASLLATGFGPMVGEEPFDLIFLRPLLSRGYPDHLSPLTPASFILVCSLLWGNFIANYLLWGCLSIDFFVAKENGMSP